MKLESVGSFLPEESLIKARSDYGRGIIDRASLTGIENESVRRIVERQIACGLEYVTSGEVRLKHWANDFWFGFNGITCERVDTGRVYQPVLASTDLLHITGRIGFNAAQSIFDDFGFLHKTVAGRAKCRQTLPSPANLLLEICALSDGKPAELYPAPDMLVDDIAEAYRLTALHLYGMGCESLQFDDTALGLMCDDNYVKRLLQGGVDLLRLHGQLIDVMNASLSGIPVGMETSVYISGGDRIVPEWEYIEYPDNIMPKALSTLRVDKFFLPFNLNDDYAIRVLTHIPPHKTVVLGLCDAHSPFPDNTDALAEMVEKVSVSFGQLNLAISPRTGFKLSSFSERALTYEDQWRKLDELGALCSSVPHNV